MDVLPMRLAINRTILELKLLLVLLCEQVFNY